MIDFTDLIHKLNEYNNNILQENEKYKKQVEDLKLQISDLTTKESNNILLLEKYEKENEEYKNKINTLEEDNTNFKKVSFVQSMNKQLTEKINYITILESQIQKYKNKDEIILEVKQNSSVKESKEESVKESKEESVKESKEESVKESKESVKESKESVKESNNKSKKKKEDKIENKNIKEKYSNESEFNPDEYEDLNGYELLCYKKKYYLRDLETSEIYDINDYKPNKVVGLITKGGKMKLNK